jgi:hypothetical protein
MPLSTLKFKRNDGQYQQYTYCFEIGGDVIISNNVTSWLPRDPQVDMTKCINLARGKFYKAVGATRTQMQGLIFLGELRETLRMLRRPAAGLQDAMQNYLNRMKDAKKGRPNSWMQNISNLWLEHSFGWMPLINDIKAAGNAWNHLINSRRNGMRQISASSALNYDLTGTLSGFQRPGAVYQYVGGPYLRTTRGIFREQHKVRYKGAIYTQVEAPMWEDGMNSFGLTLGQFVPAAWELLPWSFLADYFTNIGDILDASVVDMSNLAWVNVSTIRKTSLHGTLEVDAEATGKGHLPWTVCTQSSSSQSTCEVKRKLVSRWKDSGMSLPNFQFEFSLSDGQLGNIAGLLGSATGIQPQRPHNWHK